MKQQPIRIVNGEIVRGDAGATASARKPASQPQQPQTLFTDNNAQRYLYNADNTDNTTNPNLVNPMPSIQDRLQQPLQLHDNISLPLYQFLLLAVFIALMLGENKGYFITAVVAWFVYRNYHNNNNNNNNSNNRGSDDKSPSGHRLGKEKPSK